MAPFDKVVRNNGRGVSVRLGLLWAVATMLVLLGVVLGIAVDSDWLFRLMPSGVGIAAGASLARRRRVVG